MRAVSIEKIAEIVNGTIINAGTAGLIEDFSFNSKEGGADIMFVPVIGERTDAHNFIKDASEHGMRASFTSREQIEPDTENVSYVKVDNTVYAFQRFAAWNKEQYKLPVIGITGSVGKTTTKEMTAAALEGGKNILKTVGNRNSQIGLAQMMLLIEEKHELGVIEMGMSMEGEMERLSDIAKPEACIITNIGVSHIGLLGSRENIRKAKLNIINNFPDNGIIFLNGDDELLMEVYNLWKDGSEEDYKSFALNELTKEKLKKSVIITYGLSEECDFRAVDVRMEDGNTYFKMIRKNSDGSEYSMLMELSVPGLHNVRNALAAMAVAMEYDVPEKIAAEGLKNYQPAAMRGIIEKHKGITLIDDTYNASPDSMKSCIDVLRSMKSSRKIIVLADVLELGSESEMYHREVGRYIAENPVDILVTYGEQALYIGDEAYKNNNSIIVEHFSTHEEIENYLAKTLVTDDAVSLKGSRGMKLDTVVEWIKKSL